MSAILSADGVYRMRLDRLVPEHPNGPSVALCGVNPSTADALRNDHTIRKDLGFARVHGWGRVIKINKFAFRATDVRLLASAADPVGPENDQYLESVFREADMVVACWGPLSKLPKVLRDRWRQIVSIAEQADQPLWCLGTAKDGQPLHTLTLPYSSPLQLWAPPA